MTPTKTPVIPAVWQERSDSFEYSPAVRAGDLLFVAGQTGDDDYVAIPDPEAQFVAAFEALGGILREAGCDFADVVELMTFHTSTIEPENPEEPCALFDHFGVFCEVKNRYIKGPFPTWTAVGTTALALPGLFVEVKATAVVGRKD